MFEAAILSIALIVTRVSAFVAIVPHIGGRGVPRFTKVGLVIALTAFWFAFLGVTPAATFQAGNAGRHWFAFGMAIGREALYGLLLGYGFSLFFVPFQIAGHFVSQEMGFTLAAINDPVNNQPSNVMAQIIEMFGALLFFGLDGHHLFLASLHSSFVRRPIGGDIFPIPVAPYVTMISATQEWGLLLVAPVICCLFLTSIVMALMARVAPQLNIMTIGFPLRLFVGLYGSTLLLPEIGESMVKVLNRFAGMIYATT